MLFQEDIKEKIKLIEELRIRLVTDAVTGKIDIRDVDIPNYEFLDEDADSDADSADDAEDTEEQED
jgi:type I restriction enzyme S subunit